MEGASSRKKRKMEVEEEDEEEKIEKFFALVKSTRKVCEILKSSPNWPMKKIELIKKEDVPEKSSGVAWKLAFQPEDFLDQDDKITSVDIGAGPSQIQQDDGKEEDKEGDGLDLKLSL